MTATAGTAAAASSSARGGGGGGGKKKKRRPKNQSKRNRSAASSSSSALSSSGGTAGGGSGGGTMQIKIKPFDRPPSLPPDFYSRTSRTLLRATFAVLRHEPLFEYLYDEDGGGEVAAEGERRERERERKNSPYVDDVGRGTYVESSVDVRTTTMPTDGGKTAVMGGAALGTSSGRDSPKSIALAPTSSSPSQSRLLLDNKMRKKHTKRRPISREELYRSVEDLCSHGFGPALYAEVVKAMRDAAGECVGRLAGDDDESKDGGSGRAAAPGCRRTPDGAVVFASAPNVTEDDAPPTSAGAAAAAGAAGGVTSDDDRSVLESVRSVFADFAEYLRCVRSIFLHLDRGFIYVAPTTPHGVGGPDLLAGRAVSRSNYSAASAGGRGGGGPDAGAHGGSGGGGGYKAMGLLDVGMACLRDHMTAAGGGVGRGGDAAASAAKAGASAGEAMALADDEEPAIGAPPASSISSGDATTTVLSVTVDRCVSSLLRELDSESVDSSLVRSCVRTLSDLGAGTQLLAELCAGMGGYFEREGRGWRLVDGGDDTVGGGGGKATTADAPTYLRRVDDRLRQVSGMASYYLAGVAASSPPAASLLSSFPAASTAAPTSSSSSVSHSRLLSSIVERYLLSPHYNADDGVLHPLALHPLLDDAGRVVPDSRRLYRLGRRVEGGLERLRNAFGRYGRERGLEAVRTAGGGAGASVGGPGGLKRAQSEGSGGSMGGSTKDAKLRVIPSLLRLKSHLEDLHRRAFGSDENFGRTLRSVLEDVVNAGPGDADDLASSASVGRAGGKAGAGSSGAGNGNGSGGGDGGRLVAELLAKHVDLRFKNARASLAVSASVGSVGSSPHLHPSSSPRHDASAAGGADPSAAANNTPESFQDSVLSLFRHVHSKDVFEAFYKRDLAKRLLLGRSASVDDERAFVSKLKAECGGGYTAKMEGMFKDMELSRDVMGNYAAFVAGKTAAAAAGAGAGEAVKPPPPSEVTPLPPPSSSSSCEMDVQVLTTGYWPVYPQHPSLILPPSLEYHRTRFESYYRTKHQGRRIAWQHALGNCVVRARFPAVRDGQPRDLVVSLCQALVLLCFNDDGDGGGGGGAAGKGGKGRGGKAGKGGINDGGQGGGDGYTILDVMKKTGLEDRSEAERVLQSLSLGRDGTRVLIKTDRDGLSDESSSDDKKRKRSASASSAASASSFRKIRRSVSDHDRFLFNVSFVSNQRRIRITNVQMRETAEERTKTHEGVSRDRLYLIDAAVVRIMKARKALDHRGLMAETMNQLKFPATSGDVKKRIESLIEREYLERSGDDRSRYNYLA